MPCVARGYDEAVEAEQKARTLAYLNLPVTVCGVPLSNITPILLAKLIGYNSPFYCGGSYDYSHVAQFLLILRNDGKRTRESHRQEMLVAAGKLDLEECGKEIQAFIDLTFMDAPKGGEISKPIACSAAWLVYRFMGKPFCMEREETLNTPVRILYQEMRCWEKDNGANVTNDSDRLKGNWLLQVQAALDADTTGDVARKLEEANARWTGRKLLAESEKPKKPKKKGGK